MNRVSTVILLAALAAGTVAPGRGQATGAAGYQPPPTTPADEPYARALADRLGVPTERNQPYRDLMVTILKRQCALWRAVPDPSPATVYIPFGVKCP